MARGQSAALEEVHEPEPDAVFRRLAELGIPPEVVTESVRIGHLRGDFTTAAHPVTYPGMVVWAETTGEFRGGMANLGWRLDDEDCIPRAISPDGRVVVIPVRGNDRTGVRGAHEQLSTRRPRGDAGVRIVRVNTQYCLQLEGSPTPEELVSNLGGTWFLLYNRIEDVVRMELSYAKTVTATGTLLRWAERLILPDLDMLGPPPEEMGRRYDLPPDIEVPIARRAS